MPERRREPAPPRGSRHRDPVRAQEALLDAALVEFGAHGFAGARTSAIARRAGLSTQLITHHFGGKQGLLDELRRRWKAGTPVGTASHLSYAESLTMHMGAVLARPDWSRMVLWHALEARPESASRDDFAGRMASAAEDIRTRQDAGELTREPDPRFIALLSYLVAFAPLSLPDHVRGLLGHDAASAEYQEWASRELASLLAPRNASVPVKRGHSES